MHFPSLFYKICEENTPPNSLKSLKYETTMFVVNYEI